MKTDYSLTLPDGRKLAYAEFGQPDGYPVLFFHGNLSSRLEPLMIGDEVFHQNGLASSHQDTLRQLVKELKTPGLDPTRRDEILDQMQRLLKNND